MFWWLIPVALVVCVLTHGVVSMIAVWRKPPLPSLEERRAQWDALVASERAKSAH